MAVRSTTNGSLCLYQEDHSQEPARMLRKAGNLSLKVAAQHLVVEIFHQASRNNLNLRPPYHRDDWCCRLSNQPLDPLR